MSLVHHDARPYAVAAAEASRDATARMEALIERGRASATALYQRVHTAIPTDRLATGRALKFGYAAAWQQIADAEDEDAAPVSGTNPIDVVVAATDAARAAEAAEGLTPAILDLVDATDAAKRGARLVVQVGKDEQLWGVHPHAMGQIAGGSKLAA